MPPEIFEVHVTCVGSGAFSRLRSCRCSAPAHPWAWWSLFVGQARVHSGLAPQDDIGAVEDIGALDLVGLCFDFVTVKRELGTCGWR